MGFEQLLLSGAGILGFFLFLCFAYLLSRYKRCPANKILVIYGSVAKDKNAKCIHGGGTFILPIIQSWKLMDTHPIIVEVDLKGAFSKQNTRINLSGTFKVAISTHETIMQNASKYLLGLSEKQIKEQARDIIIGQLRLVIANLTIEEMQQELESLVNLIHKYLDDELNRIGLELLNINIQNVKENQII